MNYIILAQPTADITPETVQILKAMKASRYPFNGKSPTVSFSLHFSYDDYFPELSMLHNKIKANKRFKNYFYGLVEVDISDWIGYENDEKFTALLDYSERNPAVFAFIVRTTEKEASERIIQKIKSFSTRTVVIGCNINNFAKSEKSENKISLIREEDENEVV